MTAEIIALFKAILFRYLEKIGSLGLCLNGRYSKRNPAGVPIISWTKERIPVFLYFMGTLTASCLIIKEPKIEYRSPGL